MKTLFRVPDQLPDTPAKVTMFNATRFDSLSSRDEKYQTALAKRAGQMARLFRLKGEPTDEGERLVFRKAPYTLEIYRASDSLWWTNHDLAYQDVARGQIKLPTEDEAIKIAKDELDRLRMDIRGASISSVALVEASVTEEGEEPRTFGTAVDVNYRFHLVDLPVFGPGAKIKISLATDGHLVQVIYFWRRPKRAMAIPTISPDEALERFQRDPAFFRLRDTDAVVEIHKMQFGYFAMSPGDFQRFYVPVYAINATVRTREFPRYDFRRYIVALNISAEAAKGMDAIANPAACRVF